MHRCPADGCSRAFDDPKVLHEHVARRHKAAQQEETKLPSIRPVRPSQEKKKFEVRKSTSKGKHDSISISQVISPKPNSRHLGSVAVVEEGKKYLENETGKKKPSLGRRSSATKDHLPSLNPTKPRKLEVLQGGKAENPMRQTAPNFHSLKLNN